MRRLLIIGNGMASVRLVEALTRAGAPPFHITVVGAETEPGYNRVLLSALLARDVSRADCELRPRTWYAERGVDLVTGEMVTGIDLGARKATLGSGARIGFDECVFATGSDPIKLPTPGIDLPGVITFRDLRDVAAMEAAATGKRKVAVIGGGLLGIEAAYGLAKLGADVTLIHVMDRLMERQLDAPAARMLKRAIERKGVKVLLEKQTASITGETAATGLAFADGSSLDADLIVCAVGIRPNAALAKAAGLAVNRGIVVDDAMAASAAGFHAIGECAEHRGVAYGLVEPAYAQAEALAARLLGRARSFEGMVLATNLKVSGVPVFSAGNFLGADGTQDAVLEDRPAGVYRKLVFAGDRLVGCVLIGDADDALWYLDLIREGRDITAARADLLHGRAYAEPALSRENLAKAA
jgi:nitrite reductase (NADH) large subunit